MYPLESHCSVQKVTFVKDFKDNFIVFMTNRFYCTIAKILSCLVAIHGLWKKCLKKFLVLISKGEIPDFVISAYVIFLGTFRSSIFSGVDSGVTLTSCSLVTSTSESVTLQH